MITDASGTPRSYTKPTEMTPFQVQPEDIHDFPSGMGLNEEDLLNSLNSNKGEEEGVSEEADVAEGAAEHRAE